MFVCGHRAWRAMASAGQVPLGVPQIQGRFDGNHSHFLPCSTLLCCCCFVLFVLPLFPHSSSLLSVSLKKSLRWGDPVLRSRFTLVSDDTSWSGYARIALLVNQISSEISWSARIGLNVLLESSRPIFDLWQDLTDAHPSVISRVRPPCWD